MKGTLKQRIKGLIALILFWFVAILLLFYFDKSRVVAIDENPTGSINLEECFKVNVNTADREVLCTLPGIGEKRANAIIEYREHFGGFNCASDLLKIEGITEEILLKFETDICFL